MIVTYVYMKKLNLVFFIKFYQNNCIKLQLLMEFTVMHIEYTDHIYTLAYYIFISTVVTIHRLVCIRKVKRFS